MDLQIKKVGAWHGYGKNIRLQQVYILLVSSCQVMNLAIFECISFLIIETNYLKIRSIELCKGLRVGFELVESIVCFYLIYFHKTTNHGRQQ